MPVYFTKPWIALRSLGFIAAGLFAAGTAGAQIAWNFTDGTLNPSSVPANLTISALVAHNVGNGTASINTTSPSGTGGAGTNNLAMSATAGVLNLATSSYYEFTITAASGFAAKIETLTLETRSSATGPNSIGFYFVQDQLSPYNPSNQAVGISGNWQSRIFNGNTTIVSAFGGSLTFRIYGSGGTSSPSAANWRLDDISLAASAITPEEFAAQFPSQVPEPADYAACFGIVSLLAVATVRIKRRRQAA